MGRCACSTRRSFARSSGGLPLRDVRIRFTQKLLVDLSDARLCQTVDELDVLGDAVFRDDTSRRGHVDISCLGGEPAKKAPAGSRRHTKALNPVIALPTIRCCI